MIISLLFEVIENSQICVRFWIATGIEKEQKYDTFMNSFGDNICVLLGYFISKLGLKKSIYFIFFLILIVLLCMIFMKNCFVTKELITFLDSHKLR